MYKLEKRKYIIMLPCRKFPYLIEIKEGNELSLQQLQTLVTDYIETVTINNTVMVVGETAKLNNCPLNPYATTYYKYDVIAGDAIIVKPDTENLVGFTFLEALNIMNLIKNP